MSSQCLVDTPIVRGIFVTPETRTLRVETFLINLLKTIEGTVPKILRHRDVSPDCESPIRDHTKITDDFTIL